MSATKNSKNRVVMITGDEDVLRREALEHVLRTAGMEKDDFDLETVDGDGPQPQDWFASVSTAPFMAPRRTLVVRHLLRCEFDRLKGTDLSKLPETSLLVLVADDPSGSDDRVERAKRQRANWEKAVRAAGGEVIDCKPDPKKARDRVRERVQALGKKMSEKAAETLLEMTAGSLSRAVDEVEKLVLFVGDQEQIREGDVRAVVVPSREWNVFKMVDAIVGNDVTEALRQLRILVGSSAKAEDAAFARILPSMSRQLRFLWQGRVCFEAGVSPANAPESVRAMFPDKPNLANESPYRQNPVMAAARRLSLGRLERCFGILADTDARLKGGLSAFTPMETLERMVLEMSAVMAKSG